MRHEFLRYSLEVMHAKNNHLPIVVLESVGLSHGMPYPDNLATINTIENIIRDANATPATIVLHQGHIHIGVDATLLKQLAENRPLAKAAKQDIAFFLNRQITATTTTATTLFCANLAGLPLLVTGVIGGIDCQNNGGLHTPADFLELSTTPVTVICSGAKSILDLPKTLDMLETQGVVVVGFNTDEFPTLCSHTNGISLCHRLNSAQEVASLMHCQRQLTNNHGLMIVNPIPKSAEIPNTSLTPLIEQAQHSACHYHSKTMTPSLLQKIAKLTQAQTLYSNCELLKNNALLGSKIAIEYNNKLQLEKKM